MALPKLNAVLYDLNLPYSKKKIQYRPFVVGEQKQLMIAMETKDEKQVMSAMKQAVSACTNNAVNVATLPLFELEYLFLHIRMKSVGEKSKIVLECNNCKAENSVEVDLRNNEFEQKDRIKDSVIFLTDKIAVRMKMPNLNVIQSVQELAKEGSETELMFQVAVECIEAILEEENEYVIDDSNKDELQEFVNSLSTEQFMKMQDWFENMPVLKVKVEHTCENCKDDMSTHIQGISNFF